MKQSTELGSWLAGYRKGKNPKVSQAEVAEQAGLTRQFYGGVETGRFSVSRESAEKISHALGMNDVDAAKTLTLAGYAPRPPDPVIIDASTGHSIMADGSEIHLSMNEMLGIIRPVGNTWISIEQRLTRIEALLTRLLAVVEPSTVKGMLSDNSLDEVPKDPS